MTPYSSSFYGVYRDDSSRSASAAVPLILELTGARSVVDVGCGIGTWLRAFERAGIDQIVGVDGEYVNREQLLVAPERFVAHDLTRPLRMPGALPESFDLATCMEVGEHLDASDAATLVRTLTSLAPVVLFSAAIPHQGGTHHVNEQWPGYWAALFEAESYVALDCMRPLLWGEEEVAYYYAQNALVYVAESEMHRFSDVERFRVSADDPALAKVHPLKWAEANDPRRLPLRLLLQALPFAAAGTLRRRLGGTNDGP